MLKIFLLSILSLLVVLVLTLIFAYIGGLIGSLVYNHWIDSPSGQNFSQQLRRSGDYEGAGGLGAFLLYFFVGVFCGGILGLILAIFILVLFFKNKTKIKKIIFG